MIVALVIAAVSSIISPPVTSWEAESSRIVDAVLWKKFRGNIAPIVAQVEIELVSSVGTVVLIYRDHKQELKRMIIQFRQVVKLRYLRVAKVSYNIGTPARSEVSRELLVKIFALLDTFEDEDGPLRHKSRMACDDMKLSSIVVARNGARHYYEEPCENKENYRALQFAVLPPRSSGSMATPN